MLRRTLLLVCATLTVALLVGAPFAHAGTTATAAAIYSYDHPVAFAQVAYGSPFRVAASPATAKARVQAAFARVRSVTRVGVAAEEGGSAANIVFRGGSRTADNLTPKAKDLAEFPPGLSTFRTAEQAFGESNAKAQLLDLSRLKTLQWIEDETGHVTIAPADAQALAEWAATRGTGVTHPLTQEVLDALVGEVRR